MTDALSTRIRASSNGLFERSVGAARPFVRPLTECFFSSSVPEMRPPAGKKMAMDDTAKSVIFG